MSTPLFTAREKVELKLFNTLSRGKEPFEPIHTGKVSMYTCGPIANARMHVGDCRRFVFADLVCRYLEYRGYAVTHIMNIRDLDDRTIQGSDEAGMKLAEFTEKYIEYINKDFELLKIKPASKYPRVSEHVEDMIQLSEKLVKKGFAYEKLRSIYFDISRFSDYGKLSGVDINKIRLGATVDLDEYEKDNPRDFTLLKRSKLSELKRGIYTKTDWGNVRPSWHIQCAAISMKHLGESFDIHTGGREFNFPHHENEIAIAGAFTGKPLAKYWMHCDRVLVDGKKVDEKGDQFTLENLFRKGWTAREIRFWLLSTHYRKPTVFSGDRLDDAKNSLNRLDACIHTLLNVQKGQSYPELDQLLYDIKKSFVSAMDDDFNISVATASIFRIIKKVNILIQEKQINADDAAKIVDAFRKIDSVLKIFDFGEAFSDPEIQRLVKEREKARLDKNWDLADKIRDQLRFRGIIIRDGKI